MVVMFLITEEFFFLMPSKIKHPLNCFHSSIRKEILLQAGFKGFYSWNLRPAQLSNQDFKQQGKRWSLGYFLLTRGPQMVNHLSVFSTTLVCTLLMIFLLFSSLLPVLLKH